MGLGILEDEYLLDVLRTISFKADLHAGNAVDGDPVSLLQTD
jgi:hypothetical protein